MARYFTYTSSEYLELASNLGITAEPFTFAGWGRNVNGTQSSTLVSIGATGAGTYHAIQLLGAVGAADRKARIVTYDGTATRLALSTSAYTAGTWAHVCGRFISTSSRSILLDGGSEGTGGGTSLGVAEGQTRIGVTADSSPFAYFDGPVAEVGIWNIDLEDDECAMLAAGVSPMLVRPDKLVAYLPLGGITENDADYDIWGGNSFTAYNSPSTEAHPSGIIYPSKAQVVVPRIPGDLLLLRSGDHLRLRGTSPSTAHYLRIRNTTAENPILTALGGSHTITGTEANLEYGRHLDCSSGTVTVTGTSATLNYSKTLDPASGTVTVTGTAATLEWDQKVDVSSGAVTVTGTAADLYYDRATDASSGTITVTGTAADLYYGRATDVSSGTITVTGTAATLTRGLKADVSSGTVTITGTAADLSGPSDVLDAASGTVTVTGTSATLKYGRAADVSSGTVTVTGTAADLYYGRATDVSSGTVTVTGTAADLYYGRAVDTGSGTVTVTGTAATLTAGVVVDVSSGTVTVTGTAATLKRTHIMDVASGTVTISGTDATLTKAVGTQRYYIAADSDWNTASNWSVSSGGAGGASVPGASNEAIFDANSGDCILVGGSAECLSLTLGQSGSEYSGTLTLPYDLDIGTGGLDCTYGGSATLDMASSTVTCSGDFDANDLGTLSASNATLTMDTNGTTLDSVGTSSIGTVNLNATVTVVGSVEFGSLSVTAAITVNAPMISDANGATVTVSSSGSMTGSSYIRMNGKAVTLDVDTSSAFDVDVYLYGGATLTNAMTFGGDVRMDNLGVLDDVTYFFPSGTTVFEGDLTFYNQTEGQNVLIDTYANNGTIQCQGDFLLWIRFGTIEWQIGAGTFEMVGGNTQSFRISADRGYVFDDNIPDLVINKTAETLVRWGLGIPWIGDSPTYCNSLIVVSGDVDFDGATIYSQGNISVAGSTGARLYNGTDYSMAKVAHALLVTLYGNLSLQGSGSEQLQIKDVDFGYEAGSTGMAKYCSVEDSLGPAGLGGYTGSDINAGHPTNIEVGGINTGWDFDATFGGKIVDGSLIFSGGLVG